MKSAGKRSFIVLLCSILVVIFLFIFESINVGHVLPPNSLPKDLSGKFDLTGVTGIFDSKKVNVPKEVFAEDNNISLDAESGKKVLSVATRSDRWVEVDLSEQKLKAWEGDKLFLETLISTGLPWWPTPTGEFTIWMKLRATRMEGGEGRYYYNLPNVPYVMFFTNNAVPAWKGYGLHGTYWHNDFGRVHSHGCVNLPTPVAKELYYWAYPVMPEGKSVVYTDDANPGTKIVIHD